MPSDPFKPAAPSIGATAIVLLGVGMVNVFATGDSASAIAGFHAKGMAGALLIAVALEFRRNLRNLVRTDIMAMAAFYSLTLAEFLFPQVPFDDLVSPEQVTPALLAVGIGTAALAIGRHFAPAPGPTLRRLTGFSPRTNVLVALFALCLFGGYWNMLLAVNFDVGLMIDFFMAPRFAQPWGRGRFGDWKALIYELGMVLYLVPPIAGVILAQRKIYPKAQVLFVAAGLLFTLFYGFTSGTRNILATYLATFLVAYAFTVGPERRKEIVVLGAVVAVFMFYATTSMLEFRNVGFTAYLDGYRRESIDSEANFFVDYNLWVIARLVPLFPSPHAFLGWEIPWLSLVRPIPRALWSGKPEGMSMSIEEAVGVEGLTLASTFVGEAYMSGGFIGIALTGLFFGSMMGWWNKLGRADNSPFGHLLFASGFFAAVISMRSMLAFTTAVLPTLAAIIFGTWAIGRGLDLRQRRRAAHDDVDHG